MKGVFFLFSVLFIQLLNGQNVEYSGVYNYGSNPDHGRLGEIYVHQNSDSTLLFYLELNIGAPGYHSGAIVGQMNIYSPGEADFTMAIGDDFINCSMNFWFTNDSLYIRTNNNADNCGYGYGVYSDGDFKKTLYKRPEYYINRKGEKFWFKELDWEKWWEW